MTGFFKMQKSRIKNCLVVVPFCANIIMGYTPALAEPAKEFSKYQREKLIKFGKEASHLQSRNDPRGVVRICNQALDIVPDNINWLMKRADAYWMLKKRGLAIEDCSACIKLKPTAELYEIRSTRYKVMNDPQAALNDIQEAIKLKPMAHYVLLKAQLFLEIGDSDSGIAEAKRVLTMLDAAPVDKRLVCEIEAYEAIGLAYLQKNDPKSALGALSKALDLTPGWTAASKKNDRAALLKVANWNTEKVLCRGEAYEKLGKLKEAISDYELAVAARPSNNFDYRKAC